MSKQKNTATIAEEALRQSEDRYKAFISNSSEGIWRFELDKPIDTSLPVKKQLKAVYKYAYLAECNDAMAKMYGFSKAEELVGARLPDLMDPQDQTNIAYITDFITSGYKLNGRESVEKDKFGNTRIFENNLVGIITDGLVYRAWGTQRDITTQKSAEERQQFLEKVSNKLVVSLDQQVTLQEIAQLIVPYFADYCRIAVLDKSKNISEITVTHKDPSKINLAASLYESYKDMPNLTHGIPSLIKNGKPEIIPVIDDKLLKKFDSSSTMIQLVQKLGLKSYMGVPLIARGKVLGAMTFSSVKEKRYYSNYDLLFVTELARRIALTLDNIRLFKDAQEEIQERERITEVLTLQQERLHLAQEAANIGVFEWDAISDRVQWSEHMERLYGLQPGTFKGTYKEWLKYIHPDDRNRIRDEFYEHIKKKAIMDFEFRIVLPDGTVEWIYSKQQVFFDKKRNPIHTIGININVSERKQLMINSAFLAEASKILSSSLDYETTLHNVASLAVSQISDWCIIGIIDKNAGYQQITMQHKDPKKVKWAEAVGKEYPPALNANSGIAKVLRTKKPEFHPYISDDMLVAVAKDERHLKLIKQLGMTSVMIVPLLLHNESIGALTFISSETKRRFTKADLSLAEELAQRAAIAIENARLYKNSQDAITVRDDFISVASHELKTPVTSVKIFTQVLLKNAEKNNDDKSIKSLVKVNKQIDKLTALIYNLLDISKIQSGHLEYSMKQFSFDEMISESIEVLQHMSDKHTIILEGKSNSLMYGDEDRLIQVISNLITNAIKYSPLADKVVVHVSVSKKRITVAIQDFGIGMDKEHLQKVFERFYRVSGTTDSTFPGLGIGLYISKEIVLRHGGKLWVESSVGKGSTFYLELPVATK